MIPTDVKANKNKKKKKDLVAVSYKYLQNLKYSVKKIASYIFHLILVGILAAHFDIVCYKQGVGALLLSRQNLLSVTKLIC